MPLLWFHTCKRNTTADLLAALRDGPLPWLAGRTAQNEQVLGIVPPCVYAYLGQPNEEFGDCAFSLEPDALDAGGFVSPFDTGGLVAHLAPVRDWGEAEKRAFLGQYTFAAVELPELLELYPTAAPDRVVAYIAGSQPAEAGPHEVFPFDAENPNHVADIWHESADVRAWLWEGRIPDRMPVEGMLFWSCSSSTYLEIQRYAEALPDGDEAQWLAELQSRFIEGGPSALFRALHGQQEAV